MDISFSFSYKNTYIYPKKKPATKIVPLHGGRRWRSKVNFESHFQSRLPSNVIWGLAADFHDRLCPCCPGCYLALLYSVCWNHRLLLACLQRGYMWGVMGGGRLLCLLWVGQKHPIKKHCLCFLFSNLIVKTFQIDAFVGDSNTMFKQQKKKKKVPPRLLINCVNELSF